MLPIKTKRIVLNSVLLALADSFTFVITLYLAYPTILQYFNVFQRIPHPVVGIVLNQVQLSTALEIRS